MKKLVAFIVAAIAVVCVAGITAYASEFSHSLKSGTTSFTLQVNRPKKIILFPESQNVKTSYAILCVGPGGVNRMARTFTTPYTRNLLYKIPSMRDACWVAISAATSKNFGQIVVDTVSRKQ